MPDTIIAGYLDRTLPGSTDDSFAAEMVSAGLQGEARDAARLLAQGVRTKLSAVRADGNLYLLSGGANVMDIQIMLLVKPGKP